MTNRHPIRVLHFLSSLHINSGMMHAVLNYQRYIDPARVRFDYLYMNDFTPDAAEEIREMGSETFLVPFRGNGLPGAEQRAFFKEHEGAFDVLHCHPIFGVHMLGWSARKHGIEHVIAHAHSTKFSDKPGSARRNRMLAHVTDLFATDYIACSEAARALLLRHGKDAYIMRNAVDCGRFAFNRLARDEVRIELGVDEGTLLLGHLGRLAPQKNQAFLLGVARDLQDRGVEFKLAIAGSGKLESELKNRAAELGIEQSVMFLGPRVDAPALYSAFDCFLLPSLFEGLPVSAVEAQVSGLPCLLSDEITSEALFGRGALLSICDGTGLWADAIEALALCDEDARARGPIEARAAGFDIEAEAGRLMSHYERMMAR